jgi:HD-like signal output (HDOD) protein
MSPFLTNYPHQVGGRAAHDIFKRFVEMPIYHMNPMTTLSGPSSPPFVPDLTHFGDEQHRRRKRLQAIVDHGLPPFPNTVLELTAILSNPSADVKKASKVIRADPSLSAQVLRMCNSPMFGLRTRVISIEQATVLIGTERLRSLAMSCSLVDYSGNGLPQDQVMNFWQHSFLAALLSEHLAKHTDYCEKEQAYIAGLLHDIGQLPQWMLAVEEKAERKTTPPADWTDNTPVERGHFGMDHCEIGSCMAITWNFMPSFVDVLGYHHDPQEARHDPNLVGIIATVEHFLLTKTAAPPAPIGKVPRQATDQGDGHAPISGTTQRNLGAFADSHSQGIVDMLDKEYDRLIPLVEQGLMSTIGGIA